MVVLREGLRQLALRVLREMNFIYATCQSIVQSGRKGGHTDDHLQPPLLGQDRAILDDVLVRRQQHMELAHADLVLQRASMLRVAFLTDCTDRGRPVRELPRPVRHGRKRYSDEIGLRWRMASIRKVMSDMVWIVFPKPCSYQA